MIILQMEKIVLMNVKNLQNYNKNNDWIVQNLSNILFDIAKRT